MATQTITVAVAALDSNTSSSKRWEWAPTLDLDDFLEPAGTTRSLFRLIVRNNAGPDNIQLRMFIDANADGSDLAEAWELDPAGLTFTQGANSVTIPGPAHADNAAADATERYFWSPPSAMATEVSDFFFTDLDTSAEWRITFRVSAVTVELTGADAGATTAARIAVASVNPAKPVELTGADAGSTSIAEAMATVIGPPSPFTSRTAMVTARTNRVDLFAREHLGSDGDASIRDLIRWNVEYFRSRRSFWLSDGDELNISAPVPTS